MLVKALFAYAHFIAAFGIAATLFFEWFTFSKAPTATEARRIALADRWYGMFAMLLLVVGSLRVVYFEKGWEFYKLSGFFHLKLTLFLMIGLLSIYPTICFARWRADIQAGRAPLVGETQYKLISRLLSAQMVLLALLLLSASLMANAVGR